MSVTKVTGIIAGLLCIAIFATNFYQMQFGLYVATANTPAVDIAAIKWTSAVLTLLSVYFLVDIIRAPAPGRRAR